MSDLEELWHRMDEKILYVQHLVDFAVVDLPNEKVTKLSRELLALEELMEKLNSCVLQHKEYTKQLKEIDSCYKKYVESLQEMKDNFPPHMPRTDVSVSESDSRIIKDKVPEVFSFQKENIKKPVKSLVKAMEVLTLPEFESIPQYMKGRTLYDQVNATVHVVNAAVTAKYKILHQSVKNLNNHTRKLHQRFKDEETKDIKGQCFFVEDDIREFTQTKVDKRFQGILNMLRHCQRLREVRGGGVTRYV
uniref:SKA complex subunit 1 n=2 Tax=Gouania willdenowi TaxID=441366 RepID=A0A8C5D3R2_GOUWI